MFGALQLVMVIAGGTNVNCGTEQTVNDTVVLLGRKFASPAKLARSGYVPGASAGVIAQDAVPAASVAPVQSPRR